MGELKTIFVENDKQSSAALKNAILSNSKLTVEFVNDRRLNLTNLDKVFWPEKQLTKGNLIAYYLDISEFLIPHLKNRPIVQNRYPDGIYGKSFYGKRCPQHAPDWLKRTRQLSEHKNEQINYCKIYNVASLLWFINLGCIEIHPWLSVEEHLENPSYVIFDLDPFLPAAFAESKEVAFLIKKVLDEMSLRSYPKTSGATGIQIYVPIKPVYTYAQTREFAWRVGLLLRDAASDLITLEWEVRLRTGKVYVDFGQNVKGKTIASVYSVRPQPAASVSTPLTWDELDSVGGPSDFTLENIVDRVRDRGDIFSDVLIPDQSLDPGMDLLAA